MARHQTTRQGTFQATGFRIAGGAPGGPSMWMTRQLNAYATAEPEVAHEASYLGETRYCDVSSPQVQEVVARLVRPAMSVPEKASTLFTWVRDHITYRLGLYPDRASDTIARREGSCSNKANVLVALLRACGVPAGYHRIAVNAQTYIGPLCTWRFGQFFRPRSTHYYTGLKTGDAWIQCDPSDDLALCAGAGHLNPPAQLVEFDGETTSLLNLAPEDILEVDGICRTAIDPVFEKTPRNAELIVRVSNAYIDFVRRNGRYYRSVEPVHAAFWAWLEREHPEDVAGFRAAEAMLAAARGDGPGAATAEPGRARCA